MLLVVQVAVALLLALGAGLLTRTYAELQRVDAGFSRQTLSFAVTLDAQAYSSWAETEALTAQLITELKRLPGVRDVGAGNLLPLADATFFGLGWRVVGAPEGESLFATYLSVTPGYLEAMGLDALLGRTITEADTRDVPLVGVANEAFVREHLAGSSPIGARLSQVGSENTVEIIGVVADVRRMEMREEATPELYLSMAQVRTGPSYFVVGVDRYRSGLAAELQAAVRRVDPELPIFDVRTMDDRIAGSLIRPRLLAWLFAGFAFAAVTLAAFGLYAAVHHWIATRKYEIGVRMAVGADGRSVLGLFLRQGASRLMVGLAVGLAAYGAVARHLDEALLFGVRRGDPATLLSMVAVLAGVALAAILAAAARAVALDPVRALRAE